MTAQPFRIAVPNPVLNELQERLAKTRFTPGMDGAGWNYGTSRDYLSDLCAYWRQEYDWRKQERYLNSFKQFRTEIDGVGLHFIHERAKGENPLPLLLVHGWPDSFARFLKMIPMLTDPAAHGVNHQHSFDVIVPSLPGFGFSDRPRKQGLTFSVPKLLRTRTTIISFGGHSSLCQRKPSSGNSSRRSASFLRDKDHRASALTKSWSKCCRNPRVANEAI